MKKENSPMTWQPKADLDTLRLRAAMYEKIREFFRQRQVMEVDTPILSVASTPDPNIDSFETTYVPVFGKVSSERRYLSTSPEFPMKRLLASGSGSIYQLCHVFRQAEQGRQHNPEFTMLEWYRVEMDYQMLMEEVAELVSFLTQQPIETEVISYQSAFLQHVNVDPLTASVAELHKLAEQFGLVSLQQNDEDKDLYLDFLMSHQVQPGLGAGKLTFVHAYPASQCAFAKLSSQNPLVAERFELFYRGVELANGYQELTDAKEQQRRFERQNRQRTQQGKPAISIDHNLVEALEQGMPQCSGVALGVDRLIQLTQDMKNIEDVLAFPFNRA
ncbi:EF-P lysine aminoacylase EpmA [Kaarinaea lacus]